MPPTAWILQQVDAKTDHFLSGRNENVLIVKAWLKMEGERFNTRSTMLYERQTDDDNSKKRI